MKNDQGPVGQVALQALCDAVGKVIADHKRLGLPLVILRDGRAVEISAEQAEVEGFVTASPHRTNGDAS